ncbi:MAG: hypothetical protein KJZ84_09125 [Bryobacteraceae bacterium]|nr:hypothetical protein [Bryobacteraceae bacterium]
MEETLNTPSATGKEREKCGDEIALELMKFIASTTGYAKGAQAVGFSGKGPRTPEEQADALLALFTRCRGVVRSEGA